MRHRWSSIFLVCSLFALTAATLAEAEVRARTNRRGQYQTTEVNVGLSRWAPKVWTVFSRAAGPDVLNPEGDRNGDLWPEISENPMPPHLPWVVWSRRAEEGFSLAWSRWQPSEGWKTIRWVKAGAVDGDDLDPSLTFNSEGRPFVAWWNRDEYGHGRVYLSVFLDTKWLAPWPVSEPDSDARFPILSVVGDGTLEVVYESPEGWVTQAVRFLDPVTITDDINPLDHLRIDGEPVPIERNR